VGTLKPAQEQNACASQPTDFEIHLGVIFFCSSGRVNGISQACRLLESGFTFTKVNQKMRTSNKRGSQKRITNESGLKADFANPLFLSGF
jgi:hypothetical protein